jgi:hypothetical protein
LTVGYLEVDILTVGNLDVDQRTKQQSFHCTQVLEQLTAHFRT